MVLSLRQLVLYVLVAYWSIVIADIDEQTSNDAALKHGNTNTVVQQTQDLASLRKLTTRSLYNRCALFAVSQTSFLLLHSLSIQLIDV